MEMEADYLIIGCGIAGLYAGIWAAKRGRQVVLITKGPVYECNTYRAQGGVAAAVGENDSADWHGRDTLKTGNGLCFPEAVQKLVTRGPQELRNLVSWGFDFDKQNGELLVTREGGHTKSRVLHAGGDETGRHLWNFLIKNIKQFTNVSIRDYVYAVELLISGEQCRGALVVDARGRLFPIWSSATILATGGGGSIYARSTNSIAATGDGLAMAFRAGARLKDMEFVQFHPTLLSTSKGKGVLVTEALRGEGAIILNNCGERFLHRYHKDAELAPRDATSRAIFQEMARENARHVWLDATGLGEDYLRKRFPYIFKKSLEAGFHMGKEKIPVAPAAHYFMGGVVTDISGRTDIPGLFACGEVACTGTHGANRLASNSLLEGLVYARSAVEAAESNGSAGKKRVQHPQNKCPVFPGVRINYKGVQLQIKEEIQRCLGIVRTGDQLEAFVRWLEKLSSRRGTGNSFCVEEWESENVVLVAASVALAALRRQESRGCHFREDFPRREQEPKHIVVQKSSCGGYAVDYEG